MFLGLGFVLVDGEGDEDVGVGVVLDILDFGHFDDFGGLLGVEVLDFELVKFKGDKGIPEGLDHQVNIIFPKPLLSKKSRQPFPKIIHHGILKNLLQFFLIPIIQQVRRLNLLRLLRVNLLNDTIVLFEVDVELS